jgi:hypothetical protein
MRFSKSLLEQFDAGIATNPDYEYAIRGHNGACMVVEEIEGGRHYRCNDNVPDDDFDDIVFTVRKETP